MLRRLVIAIREQITYRGAIQEGHRGVGWG